jgi:hypothetical protein
MNVEQAKSRHCGASMWQCANGSIKQGCDKTGNMKSLKRSCDSHIKYPTLDS